MAVTVETGVLWLLHVCFLVGASLDVTSPCVVFRAAGTDSDSSGHMGERSVSTLISIKQMYLCSMFV